MPYVFQISLEVTYGDQSTETFDVNIARNQTRDQAVLLALQQARFFNTSDFTAKIVEKVIYQQ